jgi:hypothetical protein
MKKVVCAALAVSILAAGCAGRSANPVAIYVPGDEKRSCESLEAEVGQIHQEIAAKKDARSDKTLGNVVLGVLGFFVIFPWFFMDLKDAEGTEIEALQQRLKRIMALAAEKGCDFYHTEVETQ